ncbi:MAG: hypothetical protein H6983_25265 [Ectothiorhodospiraceae bacterium]|nr:hypothetical protein [Chromatiales bacterium]MCP5157510.1 hypothetical protein [Ectothiorhodospiraceae bacterium]
MRLFLAHFLIVLAAWTVVIKYALPIGWALGHGTPLLEHVYWDLWPLVHVWVAWALLRRAPYVVALATVVAVAEVTIVAAKLTLFLLEPDWSMWRTNWFVNKLFVLSCFAMLLGWLVQDRAAARRARAATARG